jgi:hypothetical protein
MNGPLQTKAGSGQRLRRWATPLTTASFAITGLTGLLMLLHVGRERLLAAHEWVGVIAVVGVVLHVLINWRAFGRYYRTALGLGTTGVVLLIGAVLLSHGHPDTVGEAGRLLVGAPLRLIAELRREQPAAVVASLEMAGWRVAGAEQTLREIARDNGRSERHLVLLLLGDRDAD